MEIRGIYSGISPEMEPTDQCNESDVANNKPVVVGAPAGKSEDYAASSATCLPGSAEAARLRHRLEQSLPAAGQTAATLRHQGPSPEAGVREMDRCQDVYPAKDDEENIKVLKEKVEKLVKDNFDGDYKKAFDHYDADGDGSIDKKELIKLLKDADVGNDVTRGLWAKKIIERMDSNGNHKIEWDEFEKIIK